MNNRQSVSFCIYIFLFFSPVLAQGTQSILSKSNLSSPVWNNYGGGNITSNQLVEQLTEEEWHWYDKFQHGLMFFDGWKNISKNILASLPHEEKTGVKKLLDTMGLRIGTEWSKDNNIRKIDTDQLRSWGKRLEKARREKTINLKETVQIISIEVDSILEQQ